MIAIPLLLATVFLAGHFSLFAEYTFFEGLSASFLYHFEAKMKDKVNGSMGYRYRSVEDETNYQSHVYVIGLSYSTVPIFVAKKFPVPLCLFLAYRERFAGKNNVLNTQYIHLGLQIYF